MIAGGAGIRLHTMYDFVAAVLSCRRYSSRRAAASLIS